MPAAMPLKSPRNETLSGEKGKGSLFPRCWGGCVTARRGLRGPVFSGGGVTSLFAAHGLASNWMGWNWDCSVGEKGI